MNATDSAIRSVVVERDLAHPPEKVWRALTVPHLIGEWLMEGDFAPEVGRSFTLRAEWGEIRGEVTTVRPISTLAYTWGDGDLDTLVTWTLVPTGTGTRLRMEQKGFRADQPRYYGGARSGWPRHLDALERLLARTDPRGLQNGTRP